MAVYRIIRVGGIPDGDLCIGCRFLIREGAYESDNGRVLSISRCQLFQRTIHGDHKLMACLSAEQTQSAKPTEIDELLRRFRHGGGV